VSLVWAMAYFVFRTRADAPSNGDMTAIDGDSVETTSP
jgi:hypothetical protein